MSPIELLQRVGEREIAVLSGARDVVAAESRARWRAAQARYPDLKLPEARKL